jgi:hypothetical protein
MNIVLDQTVDMKAKTDIGMVVRALLFNVLQLLFASNAQHHDGSSTMPGLQ